MQSTSSQSNLESIALSLQLVRQLDQLVQDLPRPRRESVLNFMLAATHALLTARTSIHVTM